MTGRLTQSRLVPDPSMTAERVRELLAYDTNTGVFTWRTRRGSAAAGSVASHADGSGHIQIRVDGVLYLAHRLAWLYETGQWPKEQIDHINRDRADNRFANLREATKSQNLANSSRAPGVSGLRGVVPYRGKWKAQINANGTKHYLGLHPTKEEAHAAYLTAARKFFGEFGSAA